MKYEDFRIIEVNIKNKRNHLNGDKKLYVRLDFDTEYFEGEFRDMNVFDRMIQITTDKGVKFVSIQHIVAMSYWVE